MAKIILGPEIGQVVKDGKIVSRDYIVWCQLCLTKKIQNHQRLTKADKKYVDSCEMKSWVVQEKDGQETKGKTCPRCHQTIILQDQEWEEPKQA